MSDSKLFLGLSTTVIGMLVVFIGLVILILCIYGMTTITGRRKKAAAPKEAPAPAPLPAQEEPETVEVEEDDGALIAVLSAAIAAMWQDENTGFVVRRIKRIQNSTARARAARDEQIYSRL